MEYQCSVCKKRVAGDMIVYRDHTNRHIVDLVKHDHPEWVEGSGICKKCVEYYEQELRGSVLKDAACAIRMRKTHKFFSYFSRFFCGKEK